MKQAQRRSPPKPADKIETLLIEQRSPEWFEARLGTVTASCLAAVMAQSDERRMRSRLLWQLAAERVSGRPTESYSNRAMERGIEMEPAALEHYAFTRNVQLERVGFVRRTIPKLSGDIVIGCSPDALVGADGLLQVKTMQPDLLVEFLESGRPFPSEHRWQCHGEIAVTGRAWCDLKIFYEGFPISPVCRIQRDEAIVQRIETEVETFYWELGKLVERIQERKGR